MSTCGCSVWTPVRTRCMNSVLLYSLLVFKSHCKNGLQKYISFEKAQASSVFTWFDILYPLQWHVQMSNECPNALLRHLYSSADLVLIHLWKSHLHEITTDVVVGVCSNRAHMLRNHLKTLQHLSLRSAQLLWTIDIHMSLVISSDIKMLNTLIFMLK